MQKLLVLISLVIFASAREIELETITAPEILEFRKIHEPRAGFYVRWSNVTNTDEVDPVLGYKVTLWEENGIPTYVKKVIDGKEVTVKMVIIPDIDPTIVPDSSQLIIYANRNELTESLRYNTLFEMRIQAYTRNGNGPQSYPFRFQIGRKPQEESCY